MKVKQTKWDLIIEIIIIVILSIVVLVTLYPLIYVFSMSISDPVSAMKREVWLLPKGFSLESYKQVFQYAELWKAYYNTIFYTVFGTFINVIMTVTLAYTLSRKDYAFSKVLKVMVLLTMFFMGNMIPKFILINKLGLYNTRWAMLLPDAIFAWHTFITISFFKGLPYSLTESATIDGCNDLGIFARIILPLSKPIISVLVLYYAVFHWNSFFQALLYLPNKSLQPMQLFLVKLLIENTANVSSEESALDRSLTFEQMKFTVIIVTMLPILVIYPYIQKYFVKGTMIGAVKG